MSVFVCKSISDLQKLKEIITNDFNDKEITTIKLNFNDIYFDELKLLNKILNNNISLSKLIVYNDDDYSKTEEIIKWLSEFLKFNTSLNILDLRYVNITSDGDEDDLIMLLCNSLKNNTSIVSLNLYNTELHNIGFHYLSETLKFNTTITELNLSENRHTYHDYRERDGYFGEETDDLSDFSYIDFCYGIRELSNVLKTNSSITKLDLSGNYIYKNDVKFLWDALTVNTILTSLNLDNIKINLSFNPDYDLVTYCQCYSKNYYNYNISEDELNLYLDNIKINNNLSLGDVLKTNSTLTEISLSWNYLNNDDIKDICEGLRANTSLNSLSLSNNEIDDKGINYINEVLKVNKTLNILNLKGNYIFDTAKQSLVDTLKNNTSLTELDLD